MIMINIINAKMKQANLNLSILLTSALLLPAIAACSNEPPSAENNYVEDRDAVRARIDTIKELDDQAELARFALEDSNSIVRHRAVDKLTDQATLFKVVEKDDYVVKCHAIKRITDQEMLAKIVLNKKHDDIFNMALDNIHDQEVLMRIVMESDNSLVSGVALDRITDRKTLEKILEQTDDKLLRFELEVKLKNWR